MGGDCRMAPDPWFSTYDSACQIAQEIAEKIQQRNQYERHGESTTKLTVTIRALLQNVKEKIALLKDLLLRAVSTHQITQLEGDRRQNLLDDLVTRERLLLASFKNEGAEPDLIRSSLMTGGAKRGVPNPWLFEEPEETRGLGFNEIRQQQQKIIQEQDAGLDALSSIISRQKQMGQEIGNELDEQNEIIDDLTNLVENTDEKLRTETRRVNLVDRKSTSCAVQIHILKADKAGDWWKFTVNIISVYKQGTSRIRRGDQSLWIRSRDIACKCPKIKPLKKYLLLGNAEDSPDQSGIVADKSSLVIQWRDTWARRLRKFQQREKKGKCKKA